MEARARGAPSWPLQIHPRADGWRGVARRDGWSRDHCGETCEKRKHSSDKNYAAALTSLGVEQLSPGDGKTFPQKGDTLQVHYTGTLLEDGHTFDSSRTRGKPFRFKYGTGRVIKGWDQAFGQLSLGERARLKIPAALAYGKEGVGLDIPPSADLAFDVELLAIGAKEAGAAAGAGGGRRPV